MNEINKILNGERKLKKLRIEGDTIGFDTEISSNWNFMPRDIEYIIENLQDKVKEYEKIISNQDIELNKLTKQLKGEYNDKIK